MSKVIFIIALLLACAAATIAVPPYSPPAAAQLSGAPKFSGGLGAGVMYGGLGTNVEYRISDMASLTAGLGLDGNGQWLLGGRMYFKPAGQGIRGRFSLGVGDIQRNADLFTRSDDNVLKGLMSIGWTSANADNDFRGWDFDITTEGRISFGYHF